MKELQTTLQQQRNEKEVIPKEPTPTKLNQDPLKADKKAPKPKSKAKKERAKVKEEDEEDEEEVPPTKTKTLKRKFKKEEEEEESEEEEEEKIKVHSFSLGNNGLSYLGDKQKNIDKTIKRKKKALWFGYSKKEKLRQDLLQAQQLALAKSSYEEGTRILDEFLADF